MFYMLKIISSKKKFKLRVADIVLVVMIDSLKDNHYWRNSLTVTVLERTLEVHIYGFVYEPNFYKKVGSISSQASRHPFTSQ